MHLNVCYHFEFEVAVIVLLNNNVVRTCLAVDIDFSLKFVKQVASC